VLASDLLTLVLAEAAALAIIRPSASLMYITLWAFATVALLMLSFSFYRLYERDRQQIAVSSLDEVRDFLHALTLVSFLELSIGQALELGGVDNTGPVSVLLLFWAFALGLLPLCRGFLRHYLVPRLNTPQNTVIVGAGYVGQTIAQKIRKHTEYNLRIVGFLDDEPHVLERELDDLPVLGGEDELVEMIRRYRVSRVILAFSKRSHDRVLELLRDAGLRDVHISIVPRYFEIMAANVGVADVEGIPVLDLPAARLSRLARFTKRSFDLAVTIPGAVILLPFVLLISLSIRLDSPGPVLFRQPRMGRDQKVFHIFKFRTMVHGAEGMREDLLPANESSGPLFKIRDDPRVTRMGAWLRKLSLDELPQLLNVLRGEMSLVGPRPFVVYEDEKINGWARRRLDLTPGITGVWQVLGRNEIEFDEMVKLDYLYVNNWSLWWDIKLLLRTIPVVFSRRGY
jgi:exopolysaccharide biosynthesis polyprenyl glycosylphosphotransferase